MLKTLMMPKFHSIIILLVLFFKLSYSVIDPQSYESKLKRDINDFLWFQKWIVEYHWQPNPKEVKGQIEYLNYIKVNSFYTNLLRGFFAGLFEKNKADVNDMLGDVGHYNRNLQFILLRSLFDAHSDQFEKVLHKIIPDSSISVWQKEFDAETLGVAKRNINSAEDITYHWGAYFATGSLENIKPCLKLMLETPDIRGQDKVFYLELMSRSYYFFNLIFDKDTAIHRFVLESYQRQYLKKSRNLLVFPQKRRESSTFSGRILSTVNPISYSDWNKDTFSDTIRIVDTVFIGNSLYISMACSKFMLNCDKYNIKADILVRNFKGRVIFKQKEMFNGNGFSNETCGFIPLFPAWQFGFEESKFAGKYQVIVDFHDLVGLKDASDTLNIFVSSFGRSVNYYQEDSSKIFDGKNYLDVLTEKYLFGGIKTRTFVLQGKLHGKQYFYRNGFPREISLYENGLLRQLVTYYPNGRVQKECGYLNNKPFGEWVTYFKTGFPRAMAVYDSLGARNGMAKSWYSNGSVKDSAFYSDGIPVQYQSWYPNGLAYKYIEQSKDRLFAAAIFTTDGFILKQLYGVNRHAAEWVWLKILFPEVNGIVLDGIDNE